MRARLDHCSVSGCTKPLYRYSRICRMHADRRARFGSDEIPAPSTTPPPGVGVRQIPEFPDYWAGDDGRIYSARRHSRVSPYMPAMRTQPNARSGYLWVNLRTDAWKIPRPVHRLIGAAWFGDLPDGLVTRHLDGDKTNNRVSNLRYGTYQENADDIERHGRRYYGERHHRYRYTDAQVAWAIAACREGRSAVSVARELGAVQSTVLGWVHGVGRRSLRDAS